MEGKRETLCSKCIHLDVCTHKDDFIDINNAVFDATVSRAYENGNGTACSLKRVSDFECFGGISISCRFFTNKCVSGNYRTSKMILKEV